MFSYNIFGVPVLAGKTHVEKVVDHVVDVVNSHPKVNIVCLSEVFQSWSRKTLLKAFDERLRGNWHFARVVNPSSVFWKISSGLLVMWNSDVVQTEGDMKTIVYDNCRRLDCLSKKGAVGLVFEDKATGERLSVVTTHMQSGLYAARAREKQFKQLNRFISSSLEGPVLVLGDFNEGPGAGDQHLEKLQLVETVLGAGQALATFSYQSGRAELYDHAYSTAGHLSMRIHPGGPSDHHGILISK